MTETKISLLQSLDQQLPVMREAHLTVSVPAKGWLRAIREALGLSQREVAARLGMKQQPYAATEEREVGGTVSLHTLRRAAGALDCELVYFLIPRRRVARSFGELATGHEPAWARPAAAERSAESSLRIGDGVWS